MCYIYEEICRFLIDMGCKFVCKVCSKHNGDNDDFFTVDKVGATGITAAGKLQNVDICVEAGDTVHKKC